MSRLTNVHLLSRLHLLCDENLNVWVRCTGFYTLCLVSQEAVNIWLFTTCVHHTVVVVIVSQCLHKMKDFEATVHEKINIPTDPESPKCCVFVYHRSEMLQPYPWTCLIDCFHTSVVFYVTRAKSRTCSIRRPDVGLLFSSTDSYRLGLELLCLYSKRLWQESHARHNDFRLALSNCTAEKLISWTQEHLSSN